jgi:glycosyltransferase involved in cell wall biosynthesis
MKSALSLCIAIPAYNEAASISSVISDSVKVAPQFASDFEILLVNDGSSDRTGVIMDSFAKKNRHIKVVHHPKNQGFSGAIKTCYRRAKKDTIFLLPGDGQIKASDLSLFWKALPGADVVVGYRINNPEPLLRKINSFMFHTVYRTFFGVKLKEISTSILWRKRVLDSLDITAIPRSALIEPEVVYKAWVKGYRFSEVGIPYYARSGGKPKGGNLLMLLMTLKELLRLWITTRVTGNTRVS